jgi:hypothetical protein
MLICSHYTRLSCIVTLSTAALSQWQPALAGTTHDSCGAHDGNQRKALYFCHDAGQILHHQIPQFQAQKLCSTKVDKKLITDYEVT